MRFFLAGFILLGIVVTFVILRTPVSTTTKPTASPTPALSASRSPPSQSLDINKNGRTYRVAWFEISDVSALSLIPNFTQKRTARSLVDNKECAEVTSGGFYTKDNQPTGLFINEGKTLRGSIPNTLFNGFFVVDQNNTASITSSPPEGTVGLALQTGPVLIRGGKMLTLAIRDDEFARRVVVGITQKEAVIFLAIYDPENSWSGPKLADTPDILSKIIARLQLKDVLNLDGGSASAFIREDLSLEELTSVGGFFCIR
ncbi:MAG: phosphodiester glycosidase family protein [Patescibacteria group bacterium]|mgnify:CR=1 FL=1